MLIVAGEQLFHLGSEGILQTFPKVQIVLAQQQKEVKMKIKTFVTISNNHIHIYVYIFGSKCGHIQCILDKSGRKKNFFV